MRLRCRSVVKYLLECSQTDNEYCDPIARNAIDCRIITLSIFAFLEKNMQNLSWIVRLD